MLHINVFVAYNSKSHSVYTDGFVCAETSEAALSAEYKSTETSNSSNEVDIVRSCDQRVIG